MTLINIRDVIKKKNKTHTLESASIVPFQEEEEEVKWEARKINDTKWGVFLLQKYCKTDEPVCYGATTGSNAERTAQVSADRLTRNHLEAKENSRAQKD